MTREDAIAKYNAYRSADPFPEIAPALLNSADVFDYIQTIGMVWPYDDSQLNGVTLSLRVGDLVVYWDDENQKVTKDIKADGEFKLKSNSIAYVQILEELRLPAYLIVRFNLRVTNTYKGLLLGTGPIVDPGFVGKINIPVHNLTNNDYVFAHGESLIEMEFTKVSPNAQWDNTAITQDEKRIGKYKNWKPTNDNVQTEKRDINYYLRRANQGNSIQSSLPPIVHQIEGAIKSTKEIEGKVENNLEKISNKVDSNLTRYNLALIFSFVGLLGVIAALIGLFKADVRELREKKYDDKILLLEAKHKQDSVRIDSLMKQVSGLKKNQLSAPVQPNNKAANN